MTTIKLKNGSGAPTAGDLAQGEPALDLTNKRLYTENASGTVIEVGTNPTSVTTGVVTATSLDISGNIDVDGTTNLDAVDIDGAVDMASTLAVGGVVTANAGVVVDNITIDGTEIDLSSGDLTIDVAGNIILDADGGGVAFKDGGVEFGLIEKSSSNIQIYNTISDGDIVFKGYDSGSGVTALTLDMSAGGTAFFADDVRLTDNHAIRLGTDADIVFYHDNSNGYLENGTGNLTLDVAGSIKLDADSSNIYLADGGTDIGLLSTNNQDLNIRNLITDKDIYFQGNDGGATITALTLDMSAAGAATFNAGATFGSGNVGIGTSSPNAGLEVLKAGGGKIRISETASRYVEILGYAEGTANGSTMAFQTIEAGTSTSTERMRIDSSGNVGIGVTPSGKLDVSISTNARGYFADTVGEVGSGNFALQVVNSAGSALKPFGIRAEDIRFATGSFERVRIDSSGNLLINDTTPSAKLWVNKSDGGNTFGARATSSSYTSTVGFFGADRNTTNGTFHYIDCYNYGSSTYRFRVADSGNVTNTNNSYGAISDIKLKENIVDATPKLNKLNEVRIVNYNFIGSDEKQLGVIAQELEQIMPNMVDENVDKDEDGNELGTTTKTVKYSVFVPMLIKAMQEQTEIINDLRARVAQLEGVN